MDESQLKDQPEELHAIHMGQNGSCSLTNLQQQEQKLALRGCYTTASYLPAPYKEKNLISNFMTDLPVESIYGGNNFEILGHTDILVSDNLAFICRSEFARHIKKKTQKNPPK